MKKTKRERRQKRKTKRKKEGKKIETRFLQHRKG